MYLELNTQPEYFKTRHIYRGYVCVTTFGKDPNQSEPFSYTIDFDNAELIEARREGIKWFEETIQGIQREGKYFLPYASPEEFELGKHAAYSVILSLVEICGKEEYEYDLLGTDIQTMHDTLEIEEFLFENQYYNTLN
jgi:hypothetical protein